MPIVKDCLSRLAKPRQGLLSTVVVATMAAVTVAGLSLAPSPVGVGGAMAYAEDAALDLGEVRGGIDWVTTNVSEYSTAQKGDDCIRYGYSSALSENVPATTTRTPYVSDARKGETAKWSYASRGTPVATRYCSSSIQVEAASAIGFQPNYPSSIEAGKRFLVGTVRHNNFPINTQNRWLHSAIKMEIAGSEERFPFRQLETINIEYPAVNKVGPGKGNYRYYGSTYSCNGRNLYRVGTPRPGSTQGQLDIDCYEYVGAGNGNYDVYGTYPYNGGWHEDWTSYSYPGSAGKPSQHPLSDDVLTIEKTTADNILVRKNGLVYRMVLQGFVPDQDGHCPADPGDGAPYSDQFVTKERAVSFGCLYGSFNQERTVRVEKQVTYDGDDVPQVNIPTVGFGINKEGVSPDPSINKTLTPSAWGESGVAQSPASEATEFLVGQNTVTITETKPRPQAGSRDNEGWELTDITCRTEGGTELTQGVEKDLVAGTVRLTDVGQAKRGDETNIICRYTNNYRQRAKLTLRKQLINDQGSVANQVDGHRASEWELTATKGSDAVLSGHDQGDGVSGTVATGRYVLGENAISGFTMHKLTCENRARGRRGAVPIGPDQSVVLNAGDDISCTFTNKPAVANLTLKKVVTGDGELLPATHWTLQATRESENTPRLSGSTGSATTTGKVPVGTYNLTETPSVDGYELVSWNCVDSANGNSVVSVQGNAVELSNGQDVVCTATNRRLDGPKFDVSKTTDQNSVVVDPNTGQFVATYKLVLRNTGKFADLPGLLTETPNFPEGFNIQSLTVSKGGQELVTQKSGDSYTVAASELGIVQPGESIELLVRIEGRTTEAVSSSVSAEDMVCKESPASGFTQNPTGGYNKVTLSTESKEDQGDNEACIPITPRFAVSKANANMPGGDSNQGAAVYDPNTKQYTATYLIRVSNTGKVPGFVSHALTDKPSFPAGVSITGITVNGGENLLNTDSYKDGVLTLIPGASTSDAEKVELGAQGTANDHKDFTVAYTFTVDTSVPDYSDEAFTCGANQGFGTDQPTGLVNRAYMDDDTDGTDNNYACQNLSPRLRIEKVLTANGGESGDASEFDVTFSIKATNDGNLPATTGKVTDLADFAPGLIITGMDVDGLPVADFVQGQPVTLTEGVIVAPGEDNAHIWSVTAHVRLDPAASNYSEEKLTCEVNELTGYTPGRGLFNQVTIDDAKDSDGVKNNSACGNANPDGAKRIITIVKTGSEGNLDGAEFALYPVDPQTPNATPINGAVVPSTQDGQKGQFTTVPLTVNRDYWLVETKAPAGHLLLATPIRFHLTTDNIVVADGQQLGSQTVAVSGGNTLTVKDLEVGRLPKSGGQGPLPYALVAGLLLTAAVVARRKATRI